jgi:pimeloyl-ACP methyl ester carboxylesterase
MALIVLELLNPSLPSAAMAIADIAKFRVKVALTPAKRKSMVIAERFLSPSRRDGDATPQRLLADLRRFAPDWQSRLSSAPKLEERMARLIADCKTIELSLGADTVKLYSWQPSQKTLTQTRQRHALLSHGWESYALSYALIIERLLALGYTVHAMDHVAHGASSGKHSGLPRFAEVTRDVMRYLAAQGINVELGIGHSLGAGGWLLSATKLASAPQRLLLLAPFIDTPELLGSWLKLHGLSKDMRPGMQEAMMAIHGPSPMEFADMDIPNLAKRLTVPTTIVQDPKDFVAPMRHSRNLAKANPLVNCIKAEGAGHVGVLFDEVALAALE